MTVPRFLDEGDSAVEFETGDGNIRLEFLSDGYDRDPLEPTRIQLGTQVLRFEFVERKLERPPAGIGSKSGLIILPGEAGLARAKVDVVGSPVAACPDPNPFEFYGIEGPAAQGYGECYLDEPSVVFQRNPTPEAQAASPLDGFQARGRIRDSAHDSIREHSPLGPDR